MKYVFGKRLDVEVVLNHYEPPTLGQLTLNVIPMQAQAGQNIEVTLNSAEISKRIIQVSLVEKSSNQTILSYPAKISGSSFKLALPSSLDSGIYTLSTYDKSNGQVQAVELSIGTIDAHTLG